MRYSSKLFLFYVKEKPVSLGAEQQFVWLSEVNIKLGGENYLRKIARGLSC